MSHTATYTVEIAWQGRNTGSFRVGYSTVSGGDTIGGFFGSSVFDDVTSITKNFAIRRGRADDSAVIGAGECEIVLKDTNGTYNPTNPDSSLATNLVPLRPVRVRAIYGGTTYGLFYGFIRTIESRPHKRDQEVVISCVDLFVWLSRIQPTIAATGATTTGAAIGKVLDSIEWTMSSFRDLDTGDSIPDFSADGTKTGLTLIQELLEAERGVCYVKGDGVFVYEDRQARAKRTSASYTVTNVMRNLGPMVDLDLIKNRARVTRSGGTEQTYTDETSRYEYGYADYSSIATSYLNTDAQAAQLAKWMVFEKKDPRPPVRFVDLQNSSTSLTATILAAELQDRVTISETVGGTTGAYHIETIEHNVTEGGNVHLTRWIPSRRGSQGFIIGFSAVGSSSGGDVIGY